MLNIITKTHNTTKNNLFFDYKKYYRVSLFMRDNIKEVVEYYRQPILINFVNNDNIFKNIFIRAGLNMELKINEFIREVTLMSISFNRFINVNSNGHIIDCDLGKVVILEEDFGRYHDINEDNYLDFNPLRVVCSDKDSIQMAHPFELYANNKQEETIDFLSIDIKGMFIQYKYWYDEPDNAQDRDFSTFVYKVLYTSLIPQYLDWAVLNRIINFYGYGEIDKFDNPHPFYLSFSVTEMNSYLKSSFDTICNDRQLLPDIFKNIVLFNTENLFNLINIGHDIHSSKKIDFYRIANLKLFKSFMELNNSYNKVNSAYYMEYLREIGNYKLIGGFFNGKDIHMLKFYKDSEKFIMEMLK